MHWLIKTRSGAAIVTAAVVGGSQLVLLYLVDSYPRYTVSAVSGLLILCYLAGFTFRLFAPSMYSRLGWGWGNSLLAFFAIGIGVPAAVWLLFFGEKLRARSRFAEHDAEISEK